MRRRITAVLLVGLLAGCSRSQDEQPVPVSQSLGEARFMARVRSWKTVRDQNVIMQQFDYSCGEAAIATLMRYYFGDESIDEAHVLLDLFKQATETEKRQIKAEGFSMLDLKRYAERQ